MPWQPMHMEILPLRAASASPLASCARADDAQSALHSERAQSAARVLVMLGSPPEGSFVLPGRCLKRRAILAEAPPVWLLGRALDGGPYNQTPSRERIRKAGEMGFSGSRFT